ncbi:hypothetical protein HF521_012485 [Silurus meridionalis]|uniref:Uncharacterized protein n=1 Tax=Silurus meridionalis TaxID=175797 RepID=A0A8T0AGV1_SILME|nr:hypothetical protein HF521_012485 [Silurus meridionalis]
MYLCGDGAALSERGLICSVQVCTRADGIQDGEPDPDLQIIFFITSVRKPFEYSDSLPERETNPAVAVRRPRTRHHPKNDSTDGADEDESQSDSEEYNYDGQRNLQVETLVFDPTPEPIEYLPERIQPEPSKELTAVKQGPSNVAKALEDVPVETYDPGTNDLPDPEESGSTAEQETENLPEEDLDNVHPSIQLAQEDKKDTSVMDQSDIQTQDDCSRRPIRDRKAAKRLTYPELGNPLVTVVQSLFQTLSEVLTDSLKSLAFQKPRVMTV